MEIFELRYFLGVAHTENIHRASERLNVSAPSLSKAIGRLEHELGIKLFRREGRRIRLTEHGKHLQRKASEIIHLEESAKLEVTGHAGGLHAVVAGPEILLAPFGLQICRDIRKKYSASRFEFLACDDSLAVQKVLSGEAHLGLITSEKSLPSHGPIRVVPLGQASFRTYVGRGHRLFEKARLGKVIPVGEVLKYPFVSPTQPLLGFTGAAPSLDGWRDDKFPRQAGYFASSLKVLEELLVTGMAIAYVPDYFAERLEVKPLRISGCPYTCVQKVKLILRDTREIGWMNQIL